MKRIFHLSLCIWQFSRIKDFSTEVGSDINKCNFEELYNEASQYVDELAERILAVGGNPVGTLTECLEQSIVKEAAKGYSAEQMVEELSQDFTNISKQLEKAIEIAGNAGDDVSEDMFIGMQTSVDKHNWMFKSYLS